MHIFSISENAMEDWSLDYCKHKQILTKWMEIKVRGIFLLLVYKASSTYLGRTIVPPAEKHLFSKHSEMGLMCGKPQHDQIGIQTV